MDVRGLGYIGVDVADIAGWRTYGELLGTMLVPLPLVPSLGLAEGFGLKIDDRPYRVAVRPTDAPEGLAHAGWEVPDSAALEQAASELEASGYEVTPSTEDQRAERQVRGMIQVTDPGGFRLELFHGAIHDHELFVSPTGVSGFVTGDGGLGHIVLGTPNFAEAVAFYTDVLGFRVSDYMGTGGADDVVFMHCNPRHHSLALVPATEPALYHFMLEAQTLDDVGYTLDRHEASGAPLSMGLGRHPNDLMVSFYSRSPSGFDVEFGCGGRLVDDATWVVTEISRPSLWGHRRPD